MMKKRGYEAFAKEPTKTQNPNYEPITKRHKPNGSSSTPEDTTSQQRNKVNGYSPISQTKLSSQQSTHTRDQGNGYSQPSASTTQNHKTNGSSQLPPQAVLPSSMPTPIPPPTQSYPSHPCRSSNHTLPPLPQIHNPTLRSAPFTHQGTLGHMPLTLATTQSYERLEWLGDAYLQLIATRLIYSSFAHLTPGRLSATREILIRNETLAQFATAYGFEKRVKVPKGGTRKAVVKVLGDVFEAYVAAVVLDDPVGGVETLEGWLRALWVPLLSGDGMPSSASATSHLHSDTLNNANASASPKMDFPKMDFPKVELSRKIVSKGIKIEYRHEVDPEEVRRHTRQRHDGKEVFKIGCYLTGWGYEGVCLGVGDGLNKTEAGNEAAIKAMGNAVTKEVEGKKREFDEGVKREREEKENVAETNNKESGVLDESNEKKVNMEKDARRERMRDVAVQVTIEEDEREEKENHEALNVKPKRRIEEDRSRHRNDDEVVKTKVKKPKNRKEGGS